MVEGQGYGFLLCLVGSDSRHHVHLLLHVVGSGVMELWSTVLVSTRYGQAFRIGSVRIPGIEVQGFDTRPVEFIFGIPIISTVLRASLRCRHAIHEVGCARNIRIGRYGEGLHDAVFRLVVIGYLRAARHWTVVTGKSIGYFSG